MGMEDPKMEAALQEGARLLTEQDLTGALEILKPLADQGNEAGCILTAWIYKLQGDRGSYRRYLLDAAKSGSGDSALLLALDHFSNLEIDHAKKWAGTARERKTPGAGQLLLRLLGEEKRYHEALKIIEKEIAYLPQYELLALCTDLKAVLDTKAVNDDEIVRVVGPIVQALSNEPEAQKLLNEPYQAAKSRVDAKAEQKRKDKEKKRASLEARRAPLSDKLISLAEEETRLQTELANLKGLFTGSKRRALEDQLSQVASKQSDTLKELDKLDAQLKKL